MLFNTAVKLAVPSPPKQRTDIERTYSAVAASSAGWAAALTIATCWSLRNSYAVFSTVSTSASDAGMEVVTRWGLTMRAVVEPKQQQLLQVCYSEAPSSCAGDGDYE